MKLIYRVKHFLRSSKAEIHVITKGDKLTNLHVISNDRDTEFDLQEILNRPFNTSIFCCPNKKEKSEIFLFVQNDLSVFASFLPDILSWHGYIIEKAEKVSTTKSIKDFLEDEELKEDEENYEE